jgi:hypothetical protein
MIGRRMKVTDDFKDTRGYWKLREELLNDTLCKTLFLRGFEPDVKSDYMMMMMTTVDVVTYRYRHFSTFCRLIFISLFMQIFDSILCYITLPPCSC